MPHTVAVEAKLGLVPPSAVGAVDSDARLIRRACEGDTRAFEAIVRRYRLRLLAHARRIVGAAGAEDAVQQAFMSAWVALQDGCEVRELGGWLHVIVQRACLHALREGGAETEQLPDALAGGHGPHELLEQRRRTRSMLSAISDLPADERDALLWTSVEGRSGRDTARALGISEGAVRQLVFRARARVRTAAAAQLPVFSLPRLLAWWQRRAGGLSRVAEGSAGGASTAPAAGLGGKLIAVACAGLLLAGPVVAIHDHDQGQRGSHDHVAVARPAVGSDEPGSAQSRPNAGRSTRGARALRIARADAQRLPAGARRGDASPAASGDITGDGSSPSTGASSAPTDAVAARAGTKGASAIAETEAAVGGLSGQAAAAGSSLAPRQVLAPVVAGVQSTVTGVTGAVQSTIQPTLPAVQGSVEGIVGAKTSGAGDVRGIVGGVSDQTTGLLHSLGAPSEETPRGLLPRR